MTNRAFPVVSGPPVPLAEKELQDIIDRMTAARLDGIAELGIPGSCSLGALSDEMDLACIASRNRPAEPNPAQPTAASEPTQLITALAALHTPWCFFLGIVDGRVRTGFGVPREKNLRERMCALVTGQFPGGRLDNTTLDPFLRCGFAAVVTGVPGPQSTDRLEQLCRASPDRGAWLYVVRASPISQDVGPNGVRGLLRATDETITRASAEGAIQGVTTKNGLREHCLELLRRYRERLSEALQLGLWAVNVCVFAENAEVRTIGAGLVRAAFAGPDSGPEPLRTFDGATSGAAAAEPAPATLLSSREAAIFARPPTEDMPGAEMLEAPRFGVNAVPTLPGTAKIEIGNIIDGGRSTGIALEMPLDDLTKHALVVGVTGGGKTTTCFHLLAQIAAHGKPFLVIESAKAEYRALARDSRFAEPIAVFTVGDETQNPLRLNPFEVPDGMAVQGHIDFLKSLFSAAFVLYPPMPYVLEQAIEGVYIDRGWNLSSGLNSRRGDYRGNRIFPTLSDLVDKVRVVIDAMGYDERIRMDVTAGLVARLDQLRGEGGKGPMLDTRDGTEMEILFNRPCILELRQLVNDDEKAFVIGLVMLRLYEYLETRHMRESQTGQNSSGLRHVTLIEEAHRLLRNVSMQQGGDVSANPKGRAIEVFSNILSEIRAYGEGIIIAEQIPTKLVPDAIKNTNLKVVHRMLSEDDRRAVGATINLDEAQLRFLTRLRAGTGVVYAEQLDQAVLARINRPSSPPAERPKGQTELAPRRAQPVVRSRIRSEPRVQQAFGVLLNTMRFNRSKAQWMKRAAVDFARQCSALGESPDAVFSALMETELERRGEAARWSYEAVERLCAAARKIKLSSSAQDDDADGLRLGWECEALATELQKRNVLRPEETPFGGCQHCDSPCQFRYDMSPVQRRSEAQEFSRIIEEPRMTAARRYAAALKLSRHAAESRFFYSGDAAKRGAQYCFLVQNFNQLPYPEELTVEALEEIRALRDAPPPSGQS